MSRVGDYFASQCGNPRGIMGNFMTWSMNRVNRVLYQGIVNELDIADDSDILDIGFGNGYLEKKIMKKEDAALSELIFPRTWYERQ